MCGIVGMLDQRGHHIEPSWIDAMNESIIRRGPDDSGRYVCDYVGLGMRRLAIIDVAGGHQPVHNEDKTIWAVFNGEIYNHRELRLDLEQAGHHFYTQSDSETLVHLYEQYGVEGVSRLRGMFAYALWDETRERLVLVRDRIGIKPLYYAEVGSRLVFASELKAFFMAPGFTADLNFSAIDQFLAHLYIPGPETIYSQVMELPPAHTLVYQSGRMTIQRYWTLRYQSDERISMSEWQEQFLSQFQDSVQSHLISDVPLGAFLSGGIDSGAIVGVMARSTSKPVVTFSIGHEGKGAFQDERPFARIIAERFQTDHHEFVVTTDIQDLFPELITCFDQPFADSSAIPNYYITKLTRQHVKVALSGLGGDELAGGYERYLGMKWAEIFRRLPRLLRSGLGEAWGRYLPDASNGHPGMSRLKRFLASAAKPASQRYADFVTTFSPEERARLISQDFSHHTKRGSPEQNILEMFSSLDADSLLHSMLLCDMNMYLPGDLLSLTDRVSMHHSLEVRVPFLDHPLIELMAKIPEKYKLSFLSKKVIFKHAFDELLPSSTLHRRKLGFSVPMGLWLRTDLRSFMCDILSKKRIEAIGYLNASEIERVVAEHIACKANHENKLWALMNLVAWHR